MDINFGKINIDENIKHKISAAIQNGNLSHAILLTGANQRIRKNLAEKIASILICNSSKTRPCTKCPACIKSKASKHPDIYMLEGSDKPRSIKIDSIRSIREKAVILPNEADLKIFIILEASSMGVEAQNALLKIIEEPPRFTRFILATALKENLLPTMQSRVVSYHIGNILSQQTSKTSENIENIANALLTALAKGNEYEFMLNTSPLEKNRVLFKNCLEKAVEILHLSLRYQVNQNLSSDLNETSVFIAKRLKQKDIFLCINSLKELIMNAEKNANQNLLLTELSSNLFQIIDKNANKATKTLR